MTLNRAVFCLLLVGLLWMFGGQALAEDYVPSVTPENATVVEATDAEGNDVTDLLVITAYVNREEMQDYKVELFDSAYNELTWDMIGEVLADTLTPEMSHKNLMIERLFYVHEKGDSGIVQLPVTVTFTTNITRNQYCEVITYWDGSARAANGMHQWKRIPSVNNGDGTITILADHYGPYATVFYRVKENPTHPEDPGGQEPELNGTETGSGMISQVPHSPQTGEQSGIQPLLLAAAVIFAGKCWLKRLENQ